MRIKLSTASRLELEQRYQEEIDKMFPIESEDDYGIQLSKWTYSDGRVYNHADLIYNIIETHFATVYSKLKIAVNDTFELNCTRKKVKAWFREHISELVYQAKLLGQYPADDIEMRTIEKLLNKMVKKQIA